MTVYIYSNMTRKNAYEVTLNVYDELKKLGIDIIMSEELSEHFSQLNCEFLPDADGAKKSDIIIAIGGDGTIIYASSFASEFDTPILGINAGRLGFLAGLEKEELTLLKNLISKQYSTDSRMMLKVRHYENDELISEYLCLNDCVVARGLSFRLCEINVSANGKFIKDYFADGLIVATPTGSTAYSLSAGGPVVDTSIESLILTPICSHSLFSRSMIFEKNTEITITVANPESCLPVFSCDGKMGITMTADTKLRITKAEKTTKLIRIKTDSFTDILTQKLIERHNQEKGIKI